MSKKANETVPVKITPNFGVPSYLAGEQDDSLSLIKNYRVLNRAKLVQGLSKPEIKQYGPDGTVLLVPTNIVLAKVGVPEAMENKSVSFRVIPIFFFNEYMKWRDRRDKDPDGPIMERSFDPASPLAAKCARADSWLEPYGPIVEKGKDKGKRLYTARNAEHLNFACLVYQEDHPLHLTPIAISMARGEYSTGVNWCSKIQMRRANLWAQIWELNSTLKVKGENQWWGWEVNNPADGDPFIPQTLVDMCRDQFQTMKRLHAEKLLRVADTDRDDDDGPSATVDGSVVDDGSTPAM